MSEATIAETAIELWSHQLSRKLHQELDHVKNDRGTGAVLKLHDYIGIDTSRTSIHGSHGRRTANDVDSHETEGVGPWIATRLH